MGLADWLSWGANDCDADVLASRRLSPKSIERLRWFWALVCLVFVVWGVAEEEQVWFIYLTNMSFGTLGIYFTLSAYLTRRSQIDPVPSDQLTSRFKVLVYLWEHAFTYAAVVTANYWLLVYTGGDLTVRTLVVHGANLVVMCFSELWLNRIHFVPQHVWLCVGAGILYVLWGLFYKLVSDDWIYSAMSDPANYVMVCVSVALFFFVGHGLTRLRERRYASETGNTPYSVEDEGL